jgi:uncharacterized protein DUF4440
MLNLIIPIIVVFSFQQPKSTENIIKDKLVDSTQCWNEGDLECFMQTYWKSDSLKFIGSNGITYGWTNTLERYKAGYPTEKERGILTFTFLSFELISDEACFLVGKYQLTREAGDGSGHFSLLWKRIEGEWLIVADHSSN